MLVVDFLGDLNMKKVAFSVVAALSLMAASAANASWFGGNNNSYGGYDDNDWPEWTPMYWMEEMMDEWDNNDDEDYYRYGGQGFAPRYGYGPMPYPQQYPAPAMAPRAAAPQAPAAQ
jgi:opacity protein-like surface antigen